VCVGVDHPDFFGQLRCHPPDLLGKLSLRE
jgi:hypothetical protein